jgi:Phosphotransferase enzyme family
LSAVIDFGCLGVGDPSCDLTIAWTLFSGQSQQAFRAKLALDSGTWSRARGWALWKAVITLSEDSGSLDEPPIQLAYGSNIFIGENFYANVGLTIIDDTKVVIGDNVMIAPNALLGLPDIRRSSVKGDNKNVRFSSHNRGWGLDRQRRHHRPGYYNWLKTRSSAREA